jgi:hypothetical protein
MAQEVMDFRKAFIEGGKKDEELKKKFFEW